MTAKLIRETKFSSALRDALVPEYDPIRCETKIEDGFSDVLAVRRADGLPCFIELKQIDKLNRDGSVCIDLDPIQPIFLWKRVEDSPHIGAAVMLRVGEDTIYTFPVRDDAQWVLWIRRKMQPDKLEYPLCIKHSLADLPMAMEAAFKARFTPATLAPANKARTTC